MFFLKKTQTQSVDIKRIVSRDINNLEKSRVASTHVLEWKIKHPQKRHKRAPILYGKSYVVSSGYFR